MKRADIIGHEGVGHVEEIGPEVKSIGEVDMVINLPVIYCREWLHCKRQVSTHKHDGALPVPRILIEYY